MRENEPNNQTELYKRLEFYQDKLLQIDWRNRSINLARIYNKWCFDLARLTIVNKVAESSLSNKKAIRLVADSDRSEIADSTRIKLRSLYRNITHIEFETGLQDTYLGFPFLAGYINESLFVRGPLVLFPVSLEHRREVKGAGWYLSFEQDKIPILNKALLTAIEKNIRIMLSASVADEFEDLLERTKSTKKNAELYFLEGLSNLLIKNDIPIESLSSYNALNETKILGPLDDDKTEMIKQKLHLDNFKVVGNFPQGDSAIYSDYGELLKKTKTGETNEGIIDDLLGVPSPKEGIWSEGANENESNDEDNGDNNNENGMIELDSIPIQELSLAIESDSSQDKIVAVAKSEECTVVRGPPGTGKSQVIVNLISNTLANKGKDEKVLSLPRQIYVYRQKRVLVVCQKRAALDVVYQRLDKIGLVKYVALLHDPNKDRKALYQQLEHILKSNAASDSLDQGLDSAFKNVLD